MKTDLNSAATAIQPYKFYSAIFNPQRTDDLKPEAAEHIGQRMIFSTGWFITPEDGGQFVGNYAMIVEKPKCPIGWIPSCDLSDIEEVTLEQIRQEIRSNE